MLLGTVIPRRAVQRGVPLPSTRSLSSLSSPRSPTSTLLSSSTPPSPSHRRPQCAPQPRLQLQTLQVRTLATPRPSPSQRTVFIHIRPPPQTLAERRAVLRVIERHGTTELFKKTASNDSFLCIASTTDMADTLVAKSPFSYDLADSLATVPVSLSSRVGSRPLATSGRTFVVSVFPAAGYPHRTAIRNGPLYGPWPDDIEPMLATSPSFKNTFTYNALRGVVPESASADALCDWRPRIAFGAPVSNASESDGSRPAPVYSHETKMARIRDRKARRSHAARSVLAGLVDRGKG